MAEKMKIIGLVGLIGSGKDVVATYLAQKYSYEIIVMGDIVRDIATELGRTHNRDDLQRTQKEMVEKYGIEYFAERVVKKIIKNKWKKVVINGIRRPEDVIVPKKYFGKDMLVTLVDVKPKIRFERMRSRKRIGDPQSFMEFMRQEKNEMKLFRLDETLKYTEKKINNNKTLEDLYKNIDKFVKMNRLG